jgi:hypothetical protein
MLRVDPASGKLVEEVVGKYEQKQNKNLLWVAEELGNELEFI